MPQGPSKPYVPGSIPGGGTIIIGVWRNGSAPALGAGGWGFESLYPDQNFIVITVS